MKLSSLLQAISKTLQTKDVEISLITDDSRRCVAGSLFVCHAAGKAHLDEAKENGAVAVVAASAVCENCIVVDDTRAAYALLCRAFFGAPDEELRLVAVTGTNGKTTTATMLRHILEMNGRRCGLLSTVTNAEDTASSLTTPDSLTVYQTLRRFADEGKQYCVMEASSQGLAEERLCGITFDIGVFTNLTRDHLDVHKTFDHYKNAKKKLFAQSKTAVIHFDDPAAGEMIDACAGKVLTYSARQNEADFTAKDIRISGEALDFAFVGNALIHRIRLPLQGEFNIENAMAAIICAMQLGLSLEDCAAALRTFSAVKGRMERVDVDAPFQVVIDYAHTPDSLRRVLLSLRRVCGGRLVLVFGCGGDRDSGKRPEMGKVAVSFADVVVVTSDNPRSEDSMAIIDEILCGAVGSKTPLFIQADRRAAIAFALSKAKKGDVVLLAGKGHETTQIIHNQSLPFDEREIVKKIVKGMF